jgi:long-chain acyl-CoA synthetase
MSIASDYGTVPGRLAACAAERPEEVAIQQAGAGHLTYGEWERRSQRVARALVDRGVGRGDLVVVVCDASEWCEYAVAYVGVQAAGAVAVPAARRMGDYHVNWVASACGAVGGIGEGGVRASKPWWVELRALEAAAPEGTVRSEIGPQDRAEVLYTSGTTGVPSGVVSTHEILLFTHSDGGAGARRHVVLHALQPASQAGQGLLLQPLDGRHQVIGLGEYEDRALLLAISRYRPTDLVLVPAMALSLVGRKVAGDADLSCVEMVRTTSAPIAPAALAKLDALFPRAAVINMYASTESWPRRVRMRFDPTRPGSVGRSEGPASIRIIGEDGREMGVGEVGSVELGMVDAPVRRYLNDEEASGRVFPPGGWVRMGDVGYLDADGYLYLVDRQQDLVITGGLNVSTLEVEAAIHEFPGVIEAAAFGVPHPTLEEYLAAAVRGDEDLDREGLSIYLETRLKAKAPKRLVYVRDFPRNGVGKVLKRELRDRLAAEAEA